MSRMQNGNPLIKMGVLLTIALFLFSCSTTLSLKPTIRYETTLAHLPIKVGIYHSREFRTFRYTADVYGNKHEFIFPIGSACDTLLRNVYPNLFDTFVYVDTFPFSGQSEENITAILEPKIESFQFPLQTQKGPYWAELIYQFTLYTPEGKTIFSWKEKGWGEAGDGSTYGEFGPISRATDEAIQSATTRFINSFYEVPEVKRWVLRLPIDGVTASREKQRMHLIHEVVEDGLEGRYEGVVAVKVYPRLRQEILTAASTDALTKEGISAIQLVITNESNHKLIIRPSDITLISDGGQETGPVPSSFVAAVLTKRYGRIPLGPSGAGRAALPNLLISLMNSALNEAERRELINHLETFRRKELRDNTLGISESVNGLVFFPVLTDKPISADLQIPVVDADEVLRFIIRIPIKQ